MRAKVVKNICAIIRNMDDEEIEAKNVITMEDMQSGAKYALIRIVKGKRLLVIDD